MKTFQPFETWAELHAYIRAGYTLYYHAPLDYRPAFVSANIRNDSQIRVTPIYSDADPFTADEGHLSRFRKEQA